MVDVKILEKDGDKFAIDGSKKTYKLKLLIKGETPQFLNALRRIIQEDVKTLAIEDVYVVENNSALWDEFISHRLGLIVLNVPTNLSYTKNVKLYLEKSGRGYVFASDIKSDNKEVYPVYPDTPIVYLEEGQKIKLEMTATFGSGRRHAKWIPAHVYYYSLADVKLEGKLSSDEKKKLEEMGVKVRRNKLDIPKEKLYDRTFLDALETAVKGKIKVIPKEEYVFVVESFGHYPVEDILFLGLEELKEKLKRFLEEMIS
ncbi:MAG TPA: DNA-directed RNA polymerase subunit D [Candidatus Nanopusillus sp.]|nr:DNA-directed RNA polymerase subunit D [Candidatus Nanopusillus sp.]